MIENLEHKIIALEIESSQGLVKAIQNVHKGNVVIVGFKKIKSLDEHKALILVAKLIKYAKSKQLAILRIGDDYLVLAPKDYRILIETP